MMHNAHITHNVQVYLRIIFRAGHRTQHENTIMLCYGTAFFYGVKMAVVNPVFYLCEDKKELFNGQDRIGYYDI